MKKYEIEFYKKFDQLGIQQLEYEWNGYLFDILIKIYAKYGIIPGVSGIVAVETYIAKFIQEEKKEDTQISRNTFHIWRKDGAPKNSETILLIDKLFPDTRIFHRPFDKKGKEELFGIYELACWFQYQWPLAMEGDEFLQKCIHEAKEKLKSKDPEEYSCRLLDAFYDEYHYGILVENGITWIHLIGYNEEMVLVIENEGKYFEIGNDDILKNMEEILRKRQECLEAFGDNLRTLFLGDDKNV